MRRTNSPYARRLNSKFGPLLPLFSSQQIGNALGWGLVDDTPNSFVCQIGHTSDFTTPAGRLCDRGQATCASYDIPHLLGVPPAEDRVCHFLRHRYKPAAAAG